MACHPIGTKQLSEWMLASCYSDPEETYCSEIYSEFTVSFIRKNKFNNIFIKMEAIFVSALVADSKDHRIDVD